MKRCIWTGAVAVSAAAGLALTGCSGSDASEAKPETVSSAAPQQAEETQAAQKPVSQPEPVAEPDEDEDISGLRLESGIVDGVTNTHLKFEVTNPTSEVKSYRVVVSPDGDAVKGWEVSVEDVPPGETVPYDEEIDLPGGEIFLITADRYSQDENSYTDEQEDTVLKLRSDGADLVIDWAVTSYDQEETSSYKVKYQLVSGGYHAGQVIYKGTFTTKPLGPGYYDDTYQMDQAGETDTGSVTIPPNKVPEGITVDANGEADGLSFRIVDVDRESNEESGA